MKKKLPFVIGILCICVFAFIYAHVKKAHPIYDNDVDTATYSSMSVLGPDTVVRQEFICQESRLDGFYLKLDINGETEDVKLVLTVKDALNGDLLSENEFVTSGLKNRKLNYFSVDSVEGYKGKALELSIRQIGGDESRGISLYIQPGNTEASMYVDENAADGVLVMKHVSERFDIETFCTVLFFCCFIWAFLWFLYRLFR